MVGCTTRVKAAVCRWPDPRNIYASDEFVSREGGSGGGRKGGDRGGNDFLSLASLCQTSPSGFSRTHSTDFLSSSGGRKSDREGQTFAKWKKAFFILSSSNGLGGWFPFPPSPTPHLCQGISSTSSTESVPWRLSTSLAWLSGGASLLSLCVSSCPKPSLPRWPWSDPFPHANLTASPSCFSPFVVSYNNSAHL